MASKDIRKLIKRMLVYWIYAILQVFIYTPFYLFGMTMLGLKIGGCYFQKITRIGYAKHSSMAYVSRKYKVHDVKYVSTDDQIDFLVNRSPSYVKKMTTVVPWEIAKAAVGLQEIKLISDRQLAYAILNTGISHAVRWEEARGMFKMDLSQLQRFCLFDGFYYEVMYVRVSEDGRMIAIEMNDGREYRSDDNRDKANYNFAKLHVQVCMSIYAPAIGHNYVHFVFPSAAAHAAGVDLNRGGILYNLLAPHLRFTERINQQVGMSLNNKRGLMNRYFYLWQAFPVTKEQIVEGIAGECKKHYVDEGRRDCSQEYLKNDKSHSMGIQSRVLSNTAVPPPLGTQRVHELFPPRYVIDKTLQKIPYFSYLKQYYEVFHWYVKSLAPYIETEEWENFKVRVSKYVARFEEVDMVEALATLLTQVAVVHHSDHSSFFEYFMRAYACTTIRTPFLRFQEREEWRELAKGENFTMKDVMEDPMVTIHQQDIMRTRCLGSIFVSYIDNPDVDLTMLKTKYRFNNPDAVRISRDFHSRLRTLDGNLKTQKSPVEIPRDRGDERAVGMQIIPLDTLINTICY